MLTCELNKLYYDGLGILARGIGQTPCSFEHVSLHKLDEQVQMSAGSELDSNNVTYKAVE